MKNTKREAYVHSCIALRATAQTMRETRQRIERSIDKRQLQYDTQLQNSLPGEEPKALKVLIAMMQATLDDLEVRIILTSDNVKALQLKLKKARSKRK